MDSEFLTNLGLTEAQANAYIALVENGKLTPPQLSKLTGENRTNAYMLLDRLVELNLAKKAEDTSKATYRALNPSNLEELVKKGRQEALNREESVKNAMPQLLSFFYTHSEQPGVRFFQGKDGILEMYDDILRTGKTLYLVRGATDKEVVGQAELDKFISKRVEKQIRVKALTPVHGDANRNPEQDEKWLMERTWVSTDIYSEPVEIDIYGDKVAFMSFGNEAIGVIIESPQIAESMRKLFDLMLKGAKMAGIKAALKSKKDSEAS